MVQSYTIQGEGGGVLFLLFSTFSALKKSVIVPDGKLNPKDHLNLILK